MATDYILFIHGVNVRDQNGFDAQAKRMFQQIKATVDPARVLKPVVLFWGDVGAPATVSLQKGLEESPIWKERKISFTDLRTTQILPFVGDAAMYLSRSISSAIIKEITQQAINQMGPIENIENPPEGDRLHLVTHSWGTVVLFDILFATRWEDPGLHEDACELAAKIRRGFFGVGTGEQEKNYGIPLASIHTMGSPIALFNLINVDGSSFDLTPKLEEFLRKLQEKLNRPLLWNNYIHPGDPIAYPLEGVMPLFLKPEAQPFVKVTDIMSSGGGIGGWLGKSNLPLISMLPLLGGGKAHGSYWTEDKVAQAVGRAIQAT
jgi:hypothetical protein